jgi:3-dehydro-4-phosphotetronate decarboxylase
MTVDARDSLVAVAGDLAAVGLSPGQSGNISVREGNVMLISPTNSSFRSLDPAALAVVGMDGAHLSGPSPSKEAMLHLAMYRRNPGHEAVIHLHSPHAVAFSCLNPWSDHCALPPLTPYLFLKVGGVPLAGYAAPGDIGLVEALDAVPWRFTGALLANHGLIASGRTLEAARAAVVEIEESARIALLVGDRTCNLLREQQILDIVKRGGTPWREPLAPR